MTPAEIEQIRARRTPRDVIADVFVRSTEVNVGAGEFTEWPRPVFRRVEGGATGERPNAESD